MADGSRRAQVIVAVLLVALVGPLLVTGVLSAVRVLRDEDPSGATTPAAEQAARQAARALAGPWEEGRVPTRADVVEALAGFPAADGVRLSENLPGHGHDGWFELTGPDGADPVILGMDVEERDGGFVLATWVDADYPFESGQASSARTSPASP